MGGGNRLPTMHELLNVYEMWDPTVDGSEETPKIKKIRKGRNGNKRADLMIKEEQTTDEFEIYEQFEELIQKFQKMKLRKVTKLIGTTEKQLVQMLVWWDKDNRYSIDGDYIQFNEIFETLDALDQEFEKWMYNEQTHSGKKI